MAEENSIEEKKNKIRPPSMLDALIPIISLIILLAAAGFLTAGFLLHRTNPGRSGSITGESPDAEPPGAKTPREQQLKQRLEAMRHLAKKMDGMAAMGQK